MIFYDLETTGLDLLNDRIIEIYALKINGDKKEELHYVVNPGIPIPPEVSDIHGFTDENVKDKLPMKNVIEKIVNFFGDEDLAGYNITKFDNIFLSEEFERYGYDLKLDERNIIDIYSLWQNLEPRSLEGALKRFCNETAEDFHGAKFDVEVTKKVFNKMIKLYSLNEKQNTELAELAGAQENSLCFGKILINDTGEKVFNFGKYKSRTIREIFATDNSYLKWLVEESNMQSDVKYYIKKEIQKFQKN